MISDSLLRDHGFRMVSQFCLCNPTDTVKHSKCFYLEQVQETILSEKVISSFNAPRENKRNIHVSCLSGCRLHPSKPMSSFLPTLTSPQPKRMHPGRPLHEAEEGEKNPKHFAHLLHNNTQWSQNEMTSFTIFMAFCLLFYTIYNHLISFFSTREEKMLMYNKSLLLQT